MSDTQQPYKTIGFSEFFTSPDGTEFKRRKGTQKWKPISSSAFSSSSAKVPDSTDFTLYLVRFTQYEGEPLYWSLVLSPTEDLSITEDTAYQTTHILEVRGDVESMHHNFEQRSIPVSLLEDVNSVYELAGLNVKQSEELREIAKSEEAPSAKNKREAKENCQGWCIRVVRRLVEARIVDMEKLEMVKDMLERFDWFNQLERVAPSTTTPSPSDGPSN